MARWKNHGMSTTIVTSSYYIEIGGYWIEITWPRLAMALAFLVAAICLFVWLMSARRRID